MLALLLALSAGAHDLRPGAIGLRELEPGLFAVQITDPQDGSGLPIRLVPVWPDGCVESAGRLRCEGGLSGQIAVPALVGRRVNTVVHAQTLDGQVHQVVLGDGVSQARLDTAQNPAGAYLWLGFEHVLIGIDHVLFVLGLGLLCRQPRQLLAAVTAFTVAHSLTLASSVLGLLSAPSLATELVIALSILLVAREALHDRPTLTRRYPWAVAGLFGLIHGFGFAGVLGEIGLPTGARTLALLLFNVGVELGQLVVVATGAGAWWIWRRAGSDPRGPRLAAYAVGIPAGIWTVERAWAWASAIQWGGHHVL